MYVEHNDVSNNTGACLYLKQALVGEKSPFLIRDNQFHESVNSHGIYLSDTSCIIEDNKIKKNGNHGLIATSESLSSTVNDRALELIENSFSQNVENGITI